ncbi:putative quinol monooxygenase [Bdellovibrio sp. HCB2-146]|uniref:putative quinol monooxygenase n=1 Tax=Bdellovibrio sp. HCB2-146 TaxID=3394362 RepID=UPI0039BD7B7D
MVKVALFVRLEAKPGKEEDVIRFLESGLALVHEEPATISWYALQMGPSTFGIFDAFPDESGRKIHLAGKVAQALAAQASDLFAKPPEIQRVDVIAAKIPPSRGQLENQPSAAV